MLNERIGAGRRFETIAFTDRMQRIASLGHDKGVSIRSASIAEAKIVIAEARQTLDLAPDEAIEHVIRANHTAIQLIEFEDNPTKTAFIAQIPLSEQGLCALIQDRFNSAFPALNHIAPAGQEPAAIYVWLIYTPGVLGRSLPAVALALSGLTAGCPLFTRAVNRHTEKLFPAMGFVPARTHYPRCKPDLLVALPAKSDRKTPPDIKIRVARTVEDIAKVFSVRAATYMAEQQCPYDEEFDGNDFCATHLIAERGREPIGCVRLRFFADWAKLERLAVRQEFRQSKAAFIIVRHALKHLSEKGYAKVYGHARHDLVRFWRTFGFQPISSRPKFHFSNVEYQEILLEMEAKPAISIGIDPLITIRPEGAWSVPGPLDHGVGA